MIQKDCKWSLRDECMSCETHRICSYSLQFGCTNEYCDLETYKTCTKCNKQDKFSNYIKAFKEEREQNGREEDER